MTPVRMERAEASVRIALKLSEAFNRHDVAGMMELLGEDCRYEAWFPAPAGELYAGKGEIARFWEDFFSSSPDARLDVEDLFGVGERSVMRWKCRGLRGVDIFRVRGGQIVEQISYAKGVGAG